MDDIELGEKYFLPENAEINKQLSIDIGQYEVKNVEFCRGGTCSISLLTPDLERVTLDYVSSEYVGKKKYVGKFVLIFPEKRKSYLIDRHQVIDANETLKEFGVE